MSEFIYAALTKLDWKYRDLFEKARDELIDLESEVASLREDIEQAESIIEEMNEPKVHRREFRQPPPPDSDPEAVYSMFRENKVGGNDIC